MHHDVSGSGGGDRPIAPAATSTGQEGENFAFAERMFERNGLTILKTNQRMHAIRSFFVVCFEVVSHLHPARDLDRIRERTVGRIVDQEYRMLFEDRIEKWENSRCSVGSGRC